MWREKVKIRDSGGGGIFIKAIKSDLIFLS